MMKYLIYLSSATKLLQSQDLVEILTVSRKNNQRNGLTGVLLYNDGAFLQIIEGEDKILEKVFETIEGDKRHQNIIVIEKGSIDKRNFPDWSMGFKSVNAETFKQFEGYKAIDKNLLPKDGDNKMLTVLKTFAEMNNMSYLLD